MKKEIIKIAKKYNVDIKFGKDNKLTTESKQKFKDKVDWEYISEYQKLNKGFIREFKDKVDWYYISINQKLSEDFIREFQDKVGWIYISAYQKLSKDFIKEFKDKVSWNNISIDQKLSEDFIREFKDNIIWICISINQKLSEDFIREFKDNVDWEYISKYQKLSEGFIKEFEDKVCWYYISKYQKLSKEFKKEFNIIILDTCWLYKPVSFKLKYIKENTDYEIIDNKYIIAYKAVKIDGHSVFNWQYKYETGKEYEAHCDCNVDDENSFGLSAWTLKRAKKYYNEGKILKTKIAIKDIGAIVQNNQKIRCRRLTILEQI